MFYILTFFQQQYKDDNIDYAFLTMKEFNPPINSNTVSWSLVPVSISDTFSITGCNEIARQKLETLAHQILTATATDASDMQEQCR